MKLLDRLLGRTPTAGPVEGAPPVSIDDVMGELASALYWCVAERPDPDVVCARLGDICRDLDLAPLDPAELREHARPLDEQGWWRLWLLAVGASREALGPVLPAIAAARGAQGLVLGGFVGVAAGMSLLTMDLLLASPLRLEELARRWLLDLGVSIEGETAAASREALDRLDYGRLLAEVDRAKLSAEDRLAYLKKLQEEQEAARPRRGKW
jgi:hypothetical protein